jgi:hypothetical protein
MLISSSEQRSNMTRQVLVPQGWKPTGAVLKPRRRYCAAAASMSFTRISGWSMPRARFMTGSLLA